MTEIDVRIGAESVRSYKRLSYEPWFAIAELVDNSTQSYFNQRESLDLAFAEAGERFNVVIAYDKDAGVLRVTDNAMGMGLHELQRALLIATPPDDVTGRSEFGMGLKTAASWMGDVWSVKTTRLGEDKEYEITFDVESVANGNLSLPVSERAAQSDQHYTIVEIRKMHQKFGGRTLGKIKENLKSIYRLDTRDGVLLLKWGDTELGYDDSLTFFKAVDGTPYVKNFSFEVNGKSVSGWAGILESGGRTKAGFAVARRGRLILGQPSAWRPQSLFGQETGSNDLVNQRLVGEIHLDEFQVSHTKNQILWQNDDLDKLEEALADQFNDYRFIALNRRKNDKGPSDLDTKVALGEIMGILENPDFVDLVTLQEVPPPEVVEASLVPLRASLDSSEPDLDLNIGSLNVRIFLSSTSSPNDPYFVGDYTGEKVSVCVNTLHRFWQDHVSDSSDVLIYALNCVYDALAEWKSMNKTGEIRPDTVRSLKDGFMREGVSRVSDD